MSPTNERDRHGDGGNDAAAAEVEALWRATAPTVPEARLARYLAVTRAELSTHEERRADVRFYVAAAAVLLIGWHATLLAVWSAGSRWGSDDSLPPVDSSRHSAALVDELTAELAGRTAPRNSSPAR